MRSAPRSARQSSTATGTVARLPRGGTADQLVLSGAWTSPAWSPAVRRNANLTGACSRPSLSLAQQQFARLLSSVALAIAITAGHSDV
ncbi:hypothetical protein PR202_ga06368 [Eleusine coracana subsp. coracana]|uniref:Uncharacterized protein n=1 Tax=Eleusine coracana subsp. coracana TaxID=191504 RepID=A0AAV5BUN6_ELECO|nr:hypothetical protein PR202_ga06368 [Eleusine coracana subsp. coracana]